MPKKKSALLRESWQYSPYSVANQDIWTNADVEKEYKRLVQLVNSSISNLKREELGDTTFVFRYQGRYKLQSQLSKMTDVARMEYMRKMLPDLASAAKDERRTAKGYKARRARVISAARERGISATEENYNKLLAAINYFNRKRREYGNLIGSPQESLIDEMLRSNESEWDTIIENFVEENLKNPYV